MAHYGNNLKFVNCFALDIIIPKALGCFRHKSICQRFRLKIQLIAQINQAFAEKQYIIKSCPHQHAVYALSHEVPLSNKIDSMYMTLLIV